MPQNRKEDVKQIVETIGLQNQIREIRIFDKTGKIIETYGGNIIVESKVNEGTKFTIILPVF